MWSKCDQRCDLYFSFNQMSRSYFNSTDVSAPKPVFKAANLMMVSCPGKNWSALPTWAVASKQTNIHKLSYTTAATMHTHQVQHLVQMVQQWCESRPADGLRTISWKIYQSCEKYKMMCLGNNRDSDDLWTLFWKVDGETDTDNQIDRHSLTDTYRQRCRRRLKATQTQTDRLTGRVTCVLDWQRFSRQNDQQSLNRIGWHSISPSPQSENKQRWLNKTICRTQWCRSWLALLIYCDRTDQTAGTPECTSAVQLSVDLGLLVRCYETSCSGSGSLPLCQTSG